ncbi:MAG: 50S ribosomal protein L13 [Patescibacteria group bacterium]|jgi:large subunit ribosomal protein L13|nr:50S ribosomal protein L13 [Patescibacteria group bacterium]
MATKKVTTKNPAINRQTHHLDATDKVVGRLATQIATLLRGKNKAIFERHIDNGDIVIVSNAAKMKNTGTKLANKVFYRHSSYPGGLKTTKLRDLMELSPDQVLIQAVWNMLPKNKTRAQIIKRLKVTK